ncbi:RloB domain-containing protein [Dehalobacterium formicoaceticum]|uniref:RloB family protein n=2 Tax=Dehalobacterium formicoaceticum TaxID=51515 RepID=A0ABT1Y8I9_9FIRM|nr:RloB domain-containing protein [Dehalobacterium formicoaceticum]MCR6547215.1 RloB family protein [Dehalobacterium formicoaceticum]
MMYRKTYFCVCDGQQEEMYLKHVAFLLKIFPERVVTFNTTRGSAERLKKNYTEYDNAALFDYDFKDTEFRQNIIICEQLRRKSRREKGKNVYHAYSNVNIDLWFILHKEDFNRPVASNGAYVVDVRRIYGLNREADIKERANLERILRQITLEDVRHAIRRADQIRAGKLESDCFMVDSVACYGNPDFSLHDFLKIVLQDCGEL